MNRRILLSATIGAVVVGGPRSAPVAAQATPEATPENRLELVYDGQLVKAARDFEADGLRVLGAITVTALVAVFDTETNAEKGFDASAEIVDKLIEASQTQGTKMVLLKREEVSAPKLGAKRHAESIDLDLEGIEATMVILRVQEDKLLHVWNAVGLGSPAEELFALADETMAFEDVDVDDDEALLNLIPHLDDMPAGFTKTDERITRA